MGTISELAPYNRNLIPEKHSPTTYACHHCNFHSQKIHGLALHIKNAHLCPLKDKKFCCIHCDFSATSKTKLRKHERKLHKGKKGYKCKVCKFRAGTYYKLWYHRRLKHNTECRFSCSLCTARYLTNTALKSHMVGRHSDVRSFKCSLCEHTCKKYQDLKRHFLCTHSDYRPFACDYCDFKTTRRWLVKRHVETVHCHKKEYECYHCGHRASQFFHFKLHIKNKYLKLNTDYKYQCIFCKLGFNVLTTLRAHIRSHHFFENDNLLSEKTDFWDYLKTYFPRGNIVNGKITANLRKSNFRCRHCEFQCNNNEDYQNHRTTEHPHVPGLFCLWCTYWSPNHSLGLDHIRLNHAEYASSLLHYYKSKLHFENKKQDGSFNEPVKNQMEVSPEIIIPSDGKIMLQSYSGQAIHVQNTYRPTRRIKIEKDPLSFDSPTENFEKEQDASFFNYNEEIKTKTLSTFIDTKSTEKNICSNTSIRKLSLNSEDNKNSLIKLEFDSSNYVMENKDSNAISKVMLPLTNVSKPFQKNDCPDKLVISLNTSMRGKRDYDLMPISDPCKSVSDMAILSRNSPSPNEFIKTAIKPEPVNDLESFEHPIENSLSFTNKTLVLSLAEIFRETNTSAIPPGNIADATATNTEIKLEVGDYDHRHYPQFSRTPCISNTLGGHSREDVLLIKSDDSSSTPVACINTAKNYESLDCLVKKDIPENSVGSINSPMEFQLTVSPSMPNLLVLPYGTGDISVKMKSERSIEHTPEFYRTNNEVESYDDEGDNKDRLKLIQTTDASSESGSFTNITYSEQYNNVYRPLINDASENLSECRSRYSSKINSYIPVKEEILSEDSSCGTKCIDLPLSNVFGAAATNFEIKSEEKVWNRECCLKHSGTANEVNPLEEHKVDNKAALSLQSDESSSNSSPFTNIAQNCESFDCEDKEEIYGNSLRPATSPMEIQLTASSSVSSRLVSPHGTENTAGGKAEIKSETTIEYCSEFSITNSEVKSYYKEGDCITGLKLIQPSDVSSKPYSLTNVPYAGKSNNIAKVLQNNMYVGHSCSSDSYSGDLPAKEEILPEVNSVESKCIDLSITTDIQTISQFEFSLGSEEIMYSGDATSKSENPELKSDAREFLAMCNFEDEHLLGTPSAEFPFAETPIELSFPSDISTRHPNCKTYSSKCCLLKNAIHAKPLKNSQKNIHILKNNISKNPSDCSSNHRTLSKSNFLSEKEMSSAKFPLPQSPTELASSIDAFSHHPKCKTYSNKPLPLEEGAPSLPCPLSETPVELSIPSDISTRHPKSKTYSRGGRPKANPSSAKWFHSSGSSVCISKTYSRKKCITNYRNLIIPSNKVIVKESEI